jgi:NAD(P)-dependent dehydrogenase (short-subunit alcohol dehydrogenase family)
MEDTLKNSNVVVTGASRGLGAALVEELASRGAHVIAVARNRIPLEALVKKVRQNGGTVHPLVADIADKDATWRIAGEAQALAGPIDILIHNASTLGPTPLKLLLDTECEDLQQVLDTNLVGPFRLSKALAGQMVLRGKGTLLHVSSDAAVEPYPRWGAYSVSKAAQDHLSRILAAELEGSGVRVLSVDPGEMDTQMHRDAIPEADPTTLLTPVTVARRIIRLLEDPAVKSGARVPAAQWEAAS